MAMAISVYYVRLNKPVLFAIITPQVVSTSMLLANHFGGVIILHGYRPLTAIFGARLVELCD